MRKEEIDNIKSQMRKGMLEFCVLSMLSHEKAYPSDILKALAASDLVVVEGTIYALLNRLKREGKLSYEWQESRQGPPRKYFFVTDYGREVLSAMEDSWNEIKLAVNYFQQHENPMNKENETNI